jgi:hypothetical protein
LDLVWYIHTYIYVRRAPKAIGFDTIHHLPTDRQRTELTAVAADAAQALARIRGLRLQLLTAASAPLPRSASDEAHARMEEGAGEEDAAACSEAPVPPGADAVEAELEALDGLLEALRARAEVQGAQAQALADGWEEEVGERRVLLAAVGEATATATATRAPQRGRAQPEAMATTAAFPSGAGEGPPGEEEEEEAATAAWALLAERLRQLGIHRLASALRESASLSLSRPGSSCGGSCSSLASFSSAHPTPCHSRPGSAASLVLPPATAAAVEAVRSVHSLVVCLFVCLFGWHGEEGGVDVDGWMDRWLDFRENHILIPT